jgi:hypothetical protein
MLKLVWMNEQGFLAVRFFDLGFGRGVGHVEHVVGAESELEQQVREALLLT